MAAKKNSDRARQARPAPPRLIPQPRKLKLDPAGRTFLLPARPRVISARPLSADDRFAVSQIAKTLPERPAGVSGRARARRAARPAAPEIYWIESKAGQGPEAYRLSILPGRIEIRAAESRGRFWAVQTLRQLILQYGAALPCLVIDDAPDYPTRGFMHDVSRGKVPKLATLLALVEQLAFLKYNHLELYIEHTFAFRRHPLLGRGHSPLSAADIRRLARHCARHHVRLVPNLQSFGHAHHTLEHPKYHGLAESEYRGGWTLSPAEPGTYRLIEELYEDFLPAFPKDNLMNVGCDETWDLGKGKTKAEAERVGLGRVYLNHLLRVRKIAARHGRRIAFWGDIIAKYPDLLPEIPRDVLLLNWEYEARGGERDYRRALAPARRSGLAHWVCPGTSSWNSFFFRRANARANLRGMARAGLAAGASGYLVTDWGDFGHYNFLSYSLWPIAYGGDCAWRAKSDARAEADFDARFAAALLCDPRGAWVKPLALLGELYRAFGVERANNSAERWLFTGYPIPDILGVEGEFEIYNAIKPAGIRRALVQARRAGALLAALKPRSPELARVREEWRLGADLAAHACRRALFLNFGEGDGPALAREIRSLAARFKRLWLARNRPSDLKANLMDFRRIEAGYSKKHRRPIVF